jgi:hypothetical protein
VAGGAEFVPNQSATKFNIPQKKRGLKKRESRGRKTHWGKLFLSTGAKSKVKIAPKRSE